MSEHQLLLSFFEKKGKRKLEEDEIAYFEAAFRKEHFPKKQILMRAGQRNTRHYYIEKGLVRLFLIDNKGKEFNVLFARERQWIGDLGSPEPTNYFLETLEESSIFSIDEKGFSDLLLRYNSLARHIRKSYVFLQKRFVSILSKTAEENYEAFVRDNPGLIQRLPQYHISSYLGITPVFLSKIIARRTAKV